MKITENKKQIKTLKPSVFWEINKPLSPQINWLLMTISLLTPLLSWWLISDLTNIDSIFLPSPLEVVKAMIRLGQKGYLQEDTLMSVFRVFSGFLLGGIIAIPLGIFMGAFPVIRGLTEPLIGVVRYMPAPAFIPLLIIYLGIDEISKIVLIFIGTVFFNILMIMDAVKFLPKTLIETTYTLGGNRLQVLLQVIFPYTIPNIIDTFRINMAAAWNLVIVAELVAADNGLGKRILLAQKFLNTDEIFACLLVLGILGFSMDLLLQLLLRLTCKWSFMKH